MLGRLAQWANRAAPGAKRLLPKPLRRAMLMHVLGAVGFPRRLADPYEYEVFRPLQPMNQFITICAIGMVASQVIFAANFFFSMFFGKECGRNPWNANSLEWMAPSPPGHGNFDFQPIVYRGPYEYSSPEVKEDWLPQDRNLGTGATARAH